jgi:FHS family L-fucose permease-like MFS transporter
LGGALILGSAQIEPEKLHSFSAALLQAYRAQQASSVRIPYLGIAVALLTLALALALIKLPPLISSHITSDFRPGQFRPGQYNDASSGRDSIWHHQWLLMSALGIFLYVGAEPSAAS